MNKFREIIRAVSLTLGVELSWAKIFMVTLTCRWEQMNPECRTNAVLLIAAVMLNILFYSFFVQNSKHSCSL